MQALVLSACARLRSVWSALARVRGPVETACECGSCQSMGAITPADLSSGKWAQSSGYFTYGRPKSWKPLYQDCGKPLGSGSYGQVFKVRAEHGHQVAIKVQKKTAASENELNMLVQFQDAPHIIQLLHSGEFLDEHHDVSAAFAMQMASGTLEDCMSSSPAAKIKFFRSMLVGLQAMHSAHVAHRDLKPENIFIFGPYDERGVAKIADLGMACKIGALNYREEAGTYLYMAPELVSWKIYRNSPSLTNDMWAAGLILHILVSGQLPHQLKGEFPPGPLGQMNSRLREIIVGMTSVDVHGMLLDEEWHHATYAPMKTVLSGLLQPDIHKRFTVGRALEVTSLMVAE